jgi:hypothetical protein
MCRFPTHNGASIVKGFRVHDSRKGAPPVAGCHCMLCKIERDKNPATLPVAPGHKRVTVADLRGNALAWAACAIYQIPAAILSGQVQAGDGNGAFEPFDAEAMLAAILGAVLERIDLPEELLAPAVNVAAIDEAIG